MNDLVKFGGGLPMNPDDLEKGLQNVQSNIQGSSGAPFMRLLKSGVYAYGAESIEPEEDSKWAVNPYSLQHGFACWGEGELLDERMVPFTEPPPNKTELPDYGHDWNQQVAFIMQCMNGEDEGVAVLYKGTSTGLRNATKTLIDSLILQLRKDRENIVPVIMLETDSYQHKRYGEIFVPIFDLIEWVSMEGIKDEAESEEEPDDGPEDEPDTGNDPPDIPEPDDDEEPPPPPRRRRAGTKKAASKKRGRTSKATSTKKTGRRRRRAD